NGELPSKPQLDKFGDDIRHHTMINETLLRFYNGFHHNAHPMAIVSAVIAAAAHKHSLGQPFVYPRNDLGYCANMLNMFFAVPCEPYHVDPVAAEALDLLFILHADHEQNASTSTVRLAGSTGA